MKKISILIALFITISLHGFETIYYPQNLASPIEKMLSFPKARNKLTALYHKMGKIKVKLSPFSVSTQNGMWHPSSKSIILNSQKKRNEGQIIRVILFEIHNAARQNHFMQLDRRAKKGMIDRESYIRATEYIEYQNLLDTIALLDEAIELGYYPESARWHVFSDFEKHYALQIRAGHSQYIGQIYDKLVGKKNFSFS